MREIKFRGKRLDTGDWIQGDLIHYESGCIGILPSPLTSYGRELSVVGWQPRVEPATVGQYTGLKDKNSREIYEGDVLRIECYSYMEPENLYIGEVVMGGLVGAGLIVDIDDNGPICGPLWNLQGSYTTRYEIIGNIHEDPELLKEAAHE